MAELKVDSITIASGAGLRDNGYRCEGDDIHNFQEKLRETNATNLQKLESLLRNGFHIVCNTPIQAEGWCGVQYLLVKEAEPEKLMRRW